jgi:hypothetical protein
MDVGDEKALTIHDQLGGASMKIRFADVLQGRPVHQRLVHTA